MRRSNAKLEHDLELGYRLMLVWCNAAEGRYFSAWCKENGIPRRRAYRLIERWEHMANMMSRIKLRNEPLRKYVNEKNAAPPLGAIRAFCDGDSDTNEAMRRPSAAEQVKGGCPKEHQ